MRALLFVVIILIAGGTGFLVSRSRAPEDPTPAISAIALRPAAHAAQPPVPEQLPELSLPDAQGKTRKLSEWSGHPLLINFWATWCEPCRHEIPLLGKLQAQHAAERLQVLGIAIDFRDAVARYAKDIRLPYPTLIAEEDSLVPQAFGVGMGLPVSVFADSRGRILTVKTGELSAEEAELILALIKEIDAGKLDISAARAQIASRLRHLAAN